MKKLLLISTLTFFFAGCNMNPSKEARIQKLETEIQEVEDKLQQLEDKIQTLEEVNEELKARILELEKQ